MSTVQLCSRDQEIIDAIKATMDENGRYVTRVAAAKINCTLNAFYQRVYALRLKGVEIPGTTSKPALLANDPKPGSGKQQDILGAIEHCVNEKCSWTNRDIEKRTGIPAYLVVRFVTRMRQRGIKVDGRDLFVTHKNSGKAREPRKPTERQGTPTKVENVTPEERWAWRILAEAKETKRPWEDAIFRNPAPHQRIESTWRDEIIALTGVDPGEPKDTHAKDSRIDRLRRVWNHPEPFYRIAAVFGLSKPVRERLKSQAAHRRLSTIVDGPYSANGVQVVHDCRQTELSP